MNDLELKAAYIATNDYRALVAKKKRYDPEITYCEVKSCQVYQDILKSISKLIERRRTNGN